MEFGISLDPLLVTERHTLYDSDEEEEELEDPDGVFSVSSRDDKPLGVKHTLLVALGQNAVTFAKSFLDLEENPVFQVLSCTSKVLKGRHFPSRRSDGEEEEGHVASSVFDARGRQPAAEDGKKFLVCTHETLLKSEYCNLWAAKLLKHINPEATIILDSAPFHEFFSPYSQESDRGSLQRSLQSSAWPHPPTAPFLEPPNTVKGEAAALLTHCQVARLAASAMVVYLPPSQSAVENVSSFQPILQHPLISSRLAMKPLSEAAENIKKFHPRPRDDLSNLYT